MRDARAVFLDRDGTLNEERQYLCDPDKLVLIPGVETGLKKLSLAGFKLFVVTNQSGIGRGYYAEADMHRVNQRLGELLSKSGVRFHKIYFAPEAPEVPSRGRKPSPAFLRDAEEEFGVNLQSSYMVGDKWIDLECGWNAGVRRSILVRSGYGREVELQAKPGLERAWICDGLDQAADRICSDGPVR